LSTDYIHELQERVSTLEAVLGEAAVHITIARAVRHQISTGDNCPYCKLDQGMLDAIGNALAVQDGVVA
jgi:hypothetical protein